MRQSFKNQFDSDLDNHKDKVSPATLVIQRQSSEINTNLHNQFYYKGLLKKIPNPQ